MLSNLDKFLFDLLSLVNVRYLRLSVVHLFFILMYLRDKRVKIVMFWYLGKMTVIDLK